MTDTRKFQAVMRINNTPEEVIDYVSDVRNRPFFISPLKSVEVLAGDPTGSDAKWHWAWSALGMMFEGTAHCTAKEPGRRYSFETEGGIRSEWTYSAEPKGQETELTVQVQFEMPEGALSTLPTDEVLSRLRQTEVDNSTQNLKIILDR